ncbi:unnamed protein product [marine sediment metagenome]|uniref:Uncharacterized protein n=1 Tax=marine sediment metagenome TaxID=412755 RepID=X1MQ67_9ZZZZ
MKKPTLLSTPKESLIDYGYGVGGGIVYFLASNLLGSGLLGSLGAAALAGSVIKGPRGTVIATVLGFQGILSSMGAAGGVGAAGGARGEVM